MQVTPEAIRWFVVPRPNPAARLRLFCFPFGGGGASVFRPWPAGLPDWMEVNAVQFPGREMRVREQPLVRVADAVEGVFEAMGRQVSQQQVRKPFALFGHSLGAFVAYELARRLTAAGNPPAHLVVSGQRPPDQPDLYSPVSHLSDEDFVATVVQRYGGIPQEVLDSPEMMELMLPLLRADFEMHDSYVYQPGTPLQCPITVYDGEDDPEASPAGIDGWRGHTSGAVRSRLFPGGHFFIQERRREVLQALGEDLAALGGTR